VSFFIATIPRVRGIGQWMVLNFAPLVEMREHQLSFRESDETLVTGASES
jgi:hypothetical protein